MCNILKPHKYSKWETYETIRIKDRVWGNWKRDEVYLKKTCEKCGDFKIKKKIINYRED